MPGAQRRVFYFVARNRKAGSKLALRSAGSGDVPTGSCGWNEIFDNRRKKACTVRSSSAAWCKPQVLLESSACGKANLLDAKLRDARGNGREVLRSRCSLRMTFLTGKSR